MLMMRDILKNEDITRMERRAYCTMHDQQGVQRTLCNHKVNIVSKEERIRSEIA